MTTYTIAKLKSIAKEQGFKLAALENSHGERLLPFNTIKSSINSQLDKVPVRFKSEMVPDGVYYVAMATNIRTSASPERYPITKGKVTAEALSEATKPVATIIPASAPERALTYESALAMQKEIATLSVKVGLLEAETKNQQAYIAELEAELNSEEGLAEATAPNPIASTLKDAFATIVPMFDKWSELQDRKIALQERNFNDRGASKQKIKRVTMSPGSKEHLAMIQNYYDTNQDEAMQRELDAIKAVNPELYNQVLEHLGLEEEVDETEQQ